MLTMLSSGWRNYIEMQGRMLKEPLAVFDEVAQARDLKRSFGVLIISGTIYALAAVLIGHPRWPLLHGMVLLLNALGMATVTALVGYGLMALTTRRRVPFTCVLPIYALSSGLTLLVAWIPLSIWVTEPWKWWLIGSGLTRCCALKGWQAAIIIMGSISLITFIFLFCIKFTV